MHSRVVEFPRCQKGSMSIEFAMVGPIFFALVFSAFEAGLMFMKVAVVDMAASEVTRQIYTGRAEQSELKSTDIVDMFCDEIKTVITCNNNVTVEVIVLADYATSVDAAATCINSTDEQEGQELPQYNDTVGGDIVFVRICVTTDLIVPALQHLTFSGANIGLRLPQTAEGKYAITVSTVFRNEPFSGTGAQGQAS